MNSIHVPMSGNSLIENDYALAPGLVSFLSACAGLAMVMT
jgi:hypothetical protein